ncbi:hypothetical protein L207DRAFT_579660 [Hyaloscypha variabilis F]|uniref:Uncharacterized protein n=1 Tax=Hyaloscypha variabilis (strain UAMH 11265 / GT02V1 / F) TaxID=1149755 RepID=A0A2J6S1T6_HYAVF|nr:hypothetical protein L207DRAFT_579660 [Hyaloscypha variabilis F]
MATSFSSQNQSSFQVSWQTAYWTLIPLAVNTMAQPSGRVLGLPPKYHTYLRCSPIICAVDTLSILIHLISYLKSYSIKEAIPLFIRERFGDDEEDVEGIQAIEKAIKLMAMDGIFWTKTWGAMFLVSFLVVEVLVILSWKYSSHTPLPETQDTHRTLRIRANMERSDEQLMALSANLYFFILVSAIIDIYNGFEFSSMLERDPIILSAPVTFIQTLWGILVLWGFLIFVPSIIYFVLLVVWPKPPFVEEYMANNTFTYGKYGPAARIAIRISGLACLGIMGLSITQWKAALLK